MSLTSAFGKFFTRTKSSDEKDIRNIYKEWNIQREFAANFGSNHVSEIDAIFSRHLNG